MERGAICRDNQQRICGVELPQNPDASRTEVAKRAAGSWWGGFQLDRQMLLPALFQPEKQPWIPIADPLR